MLEIIDSYYWGKDKKVLTYNDHNIKGLRNFAHWNLGKAIPSIPMHFHSDIMEIHCLVKGKRECSIEDKNYTITGNELFITYPFEPHSIGAHFQTPCEFYAFQLNLKEKNILGLDEEFSQHLVDLLGGLKDRHLIVEKNDITNLKIAFDLISEDIFESSYLGVQYLCCFLFNLPNLAPAVSGGSSGINPSIQKALDFIDKNISENLHLSDIADQVGYSITQFKNNFKDETGVTPSDYISFTKIEHAKKLLILTDKSINDISLSLGYATSNYFASVFKKYTTFSPKEYRSNFSLNK